MEWPVNVWVRIKPLSTTEAEDDRNHDWRVVDNTVTINGVKHKDSFAFDHVFGDDK